MYHLKFDVYEPGLRPSVLQEPNDVKDATRIHTKVKMLGTFGVLPMVILPGVPLAAIGCHCYHWQSETSEQMATFLLVVNNESRSSFATALLQKQIDPRIPIHNIFAI